SCRRLMGYPQSKDHNVTTSLWESRVVHHSKIDRRMAEMGSISTELADAKRRFVSAVPPISTDSVPRNERSQRANRDRTQRSKIHCLFDHLAARTSVRGTSRPSILELVIRSPGQHPAYRGLMRADAGWPGTLKRLPVYVIVVPLTRRIEKS